MARTAWKEHYLHNLYHTGFVHLVLDGLPQETVVPRLWPSQNSMGFDSTLARPMNATLPSCLFLLPFIQTLHLAGIGLRGRLDPNIKNWPFNLTDLVLSNNRITQSIPVQLQRQASKLSKIDFSFNRINGTLSEMTMPSTAFFATVNRFLG